MNLLSSAKEYGVTLEIKSPKQDIKGKNPMSFSCCPLRIHGVYTGLYPRPSDLSGWLSFFFFCILLTETHRPNWEAKWMCEVITCLHCYVSQRKQLEVLKLEHRFPRSIYVLIARLRHTKQTCKCKWNIKKADTSILLTSNRKDSLSV